MLECANAAAACLIPDGQPASLFIADVILSSPIILNLKVHHCKKRSDFMPPSKSSS